MLLQMSASNCLSIATKQEISFVATKLKGPEISLFTLPNSDIEVVPSAVIYGANASGKSNFINAFRFMTDSILQSHTHGNPEGGVPRIPFGLNKEYLDTPSEFEVNFIVDKIRFQYGFTCDNDRFLAEWLYSYPEGKRRKLFERNKSDVEFGQNFKGQKKILVDLMRPNSLFISTATQNDHEELGKIATFFRRIKFSSNVSVAKKLLNNTFKKDQIDARTIKFLTAIGTGITGYRQIDMDIPDFVKNLFKEFSQIARKHLGEGHLIDDISAGREKDVAIELAHLGADGESRYFGLERESSGTRRLILIMNLVFKALDEGSLVVVDELDASLHTFAAEQVLKLFSDPEVNKNGAQLIATTHDTNLLNSSCLRRDQIWFCEKDNEGASHLFPLSEIKSRQTDNFERGYLEGRYGAIPCSSNLSSLFRG